MMLACVVLQSAALLLPSGAPRRAAARTVVPSMIDIDMSSIDLSSIDLSAAEAGVRSAADSLKPAVDAASAGDLEGAASALASAGPAALTLPVALLAANSIFGGLFAGKLPPPPESLTAGTVLQGRDLKLAYRASREIAVARFTTFKQPHSRQAANTSSTVRDAV